MISRQGSTAPKTASEQPYYSDIERWSNAYRAQCDGCGQLPGFVLKDESGPTLTQCADCLTETFRKDPEMTKRILQAVAERL